MAQVSVEMPEGLKEGAETIAERQGYTGLSEFIRDCVRQNVPEEAMRRYGDAGQFIEGFFRNLEVGVRQQWVELQARRADRRGTLPSKDVLEDDLNRMISGVVENEATYIADEYWYEATEWLMERDLEPYGRGDEAD